MSNILFIFEGEKTENQIINNLTKHFINEQKNTLITCAYCAEIYQLHKEISKDSS
jgi:redox-regulated HSP33 family molecular chaperone